ncbi:MAG: Ig-like domain-containing protein [Bacteroidales bacterium]|nr:Ig-like domain-containing protein [Bacteroidales bacterium]
MRKYIALLAALLALAAGCTQEIDPSSVTLSKHDLSLTIGETTVLAATIEPAGATNTALSWSSTAPAVATVDQEGTVTAVGEGQAIVTVATLAGGKTDACVVSVCKPFVPVTGVKLDKTELELIKGEEYSLTATVEPAGATNPSVSFSSSDPEVAGVDASGCVKALKPGSAVITVKTDEGDYTASCAVTVIRASQDKVYYFCKGELLYLDGEPDPLNGAFDEDKIKLYYIMAICADGQSLYSHEAYYDSWNHEYIFYVCKDRKPVYTINKTSWDDPTMDMAARNGRVAIVYQRNDREYNYVVVVNPDGTVMSDVIPGDYHNMYSINCALSPSGDLYIAASYRDPSNGYHLGLYKYSSSGEWTFSILQDYSYDGLVDISESGDVYVLTLKQKGGYDAMLYKNVTDCSAIYHSPDYFQYALSLAGSHLHTAFLKWGEKAVITELCDGNAVRTIETEVDQQFLSSSESSIRVTSSGDSYIATSNHIFKNGELLYTISNPNWFEGFCIVE